MLNKILKYDLKSMFKSLIPFYICTIALGLIVRISNMIQDRFSLFSFIYSTTLSFFIILLIITFFYTFFVAIKRFYNNMLKDEGYLTNTLPVTKENLIASKVIASFITFIASVFVIIISLLIAFYTKGVLEDILKSINELISVSGYSSFTVYTYMILLMITGYIGYIVTVYLALILGHSRNTNKLMYSFIYGIVIYMIMQVLSTVMLGVAILIDNNLLEIMQTGEDAAIGQMNSIFILSMLLSIGTTIAQYILSIKVINKKLNLE